jgi:hypothetical protein
MSRQKSRQNKAIYFNQSLIGSNPNGSLLKLSSKKNVASQHYSMKTHSTLEGLSEEEKKEILCNCSGLHKFLQQSVKANW